MTGFRKNRQRGAAAHVCHFIDLAELKRSLTRPAGAPHGATGEALGSNVLPGPGSGGFQVWREPGLSEATNGRPLGTAGQPHPDRYHGAEARIPTDARSSVVPAADGTTGRLEAPRAPLADVEDSGFRQQIDLLERRVQKLVRQLEVREGELERLAQEPEEEGIASTYQRVQGVQENGARGKLKQKLMSKIFEANLKLQERVSSLRRTAE